MKDKNISTREARGFDELRIIEGLQRDIFKYQESQIIGSNEIATFQKNGGIVLLAYDNHANKSIGFLISCIGFRNSETYQHLLLVGVLPDYRSTGIGFKLLTKQLEHAVEQGVKYITLYIDPLEGNISRLIIGKLSGKVVEYSQNLFGSNLGGIDSGLDTDRLAVRVDIDNAILSHALNYPSKKEIVSTDVSKGGRPKITSFRADFVSEKTLVEAPYDIQKIKLLDMNLAKDWRLKTRTTLIDLLKRYDIVDFITSHTLEKRNFFVLEPSK